MSLSLPDGRARGWAQARAYAEQLLGPGLGRPTSAVHPCLHPVLDLVAATVEVRSTLEGRASAQVAVLGNGTAEVLRPGWRPCWSPEGTRLANVNERGIQVDDRELELTGSVERLAWSPDGTRLLVLLAERGSEVPNVDGSGLVRSGADADAWLPDVSSGDADLAWRRLLVVDAESLQWTHVGRPDLNAWDACWAGDAALLAVCSDGTSQESAWFRADVRRIDVATSADELLHRPPTQLGAISGSPDGRRVAFVEAVCSDRDISAGELHLHDRSAGETRRLEVPCDVTHVSFVTDDEIGFAGLRGLATVVGTVGIDGRVQVLWESERESTSGVQPDASFRPGRAAFVQVGFRQPPRASLVADGVVTTLASLAHDGSRLVADAPWTSQVRRWAAPDGLEIEGWLHLPEGDGPHPLVVSVHGGPVGCHRSLWPSPGFALPYLLGRGYAVLQPNPRGSTGRGLAFAGAVVGDMGGADTADITSGVADLVAAGLVDPARVGVMGGSYGGYMTAWLVTQSDLFSAAVAMHPVTDWLQQHGTSNIPYWDELFLDGKPYAPDGLYKQRSPLTHVAQVSTPTLFIAGLQDRATPPGQALVMHRALLDQGVASDCVVFQHEGHGARDLSAAIDNVARVTDWFDRWLSRS